MGSKGGEDSQQRVVRTVSGEGGVRFGNSIWYNCREKEWRSIESAVHEAHEDELQEVAIWSSQCFLDHNCDLYSIFLTNTMVAFLFSFLSNLFLLGPLPRHYMCVRDFCLLLMVVNYSMLLSQ